MVLFFYGYILSICLLCWRGGGYWAVVGVGQGVGGVWAPVRPNTYYVGIPLGMSCWFEVNFGELICCNDFVVVISWLSFNLDVGVVDIWAVGGVGQGVGGVLSPVRPSLDYVGIRSFILVVLVLLWLNGLFHGLSSFARWVALMWSDGLVMHWLILLV